MTRYGVCECGKWGEAPKEFRENLHFLKCKCGKLMYLQNMSPKEAGYRDSSKVTITFVKQ